MRAHKTKREQENSNNNNNEINTAIQQYKESSSQEYSAQQNVKIHQEKREIYAKENELLQISVR